MKKINTAPISGMQEFLPATQRVFNEIKDKINEVYRRHGFLNIETPIIDRCEILLAKAGGDTEKQIYRVVKTAEAAEGADQALRFDHTVPLARYVVEHENDLTFPFKVYQIGRNFRGERPQKGRFRELYQCDVDVIGRGELPIYYDADVISTLLDAYEGFLTTKVVARLSNRKILSGALCALELEEKAEEIYSIIDHSEKVPYEKTEMAFVEAGLDEADRDLMLKFIGINGGREEVVRNLTELGLENDDFKEGIKQLDTVMKMLEEDGLSDRIMADMKIVRGLDYYTGTVFEFMLPEYRQIGSVGGGGRYENLAGHFTDQKMPGVGGSIGLSRLFYVLRENGLTREEKQKPIDTAIVPISENEIPYAMRLAKKLRDDGKTVTVILTNRKLGDKLTYAAKLAKNGIVIGETEVATGEYQIKEFR